MKSLHQGLGTSVLIFTLAVLGGCGDPSNDAGAPPKLSFIRWGIRSNIPVSAHKVFDVTIGGQAFQDLQIALDGDDLLLADGRIGLARISVAASAPQMRYATSQVATFNAANLPWSHSDHTRIGLLPMAGSVLTLGNSSVRLVEETETGPRLAVTQPSVDERVYGAMVPGKHEGDIVFFDRNGAVFAQRLSNGVLGTIPGTWPGAVAFNEQVRSAVRVEEIVLIATNRGLYEMRFRDDGNPLPPQRVSAMNVSALAASGDHVYMARGNDRVIDVFRKDGYHEGCFSLPSAPERFVVHAEQPVVYYAADGVLNGATWDLDEKPTGWSR